MESTGKSKGILLPTWFLSAALGFFLSVSIAIGGTAITTWSAAQANTEKNIDQDARLSELEKSQLDIASMKAEISATHELAINTNNKLDRLIDRALDKNNSK